MNYSLAQKISNLILEAQGMIAKERIVIYEAQSMTGLIAKERRSPCFCLVGKPFVEYVKNGKPNTNLFLWKAKHKLQRHRIWLA